MFDEFRKFAVKGNMVDMAVGIIIGAAFGTVVSSLVNDVIMPIVSAVFGTPDFSNLFIVLRSPADAAGVNMESIEAIRAAGGVALAYGLFINAVIAFLIVAVALFFVVKGMNELQRRKEAELVEAPAPELPAQEKLLAEIRDLLKAQAESS